MVVKISYDRDGFIQQIKNLENKIPADLIVKIELNEFLMSFTPSERNPWRGIGFSIYNLV